MLAAQQSKGTFFFFFCLFFFCFFFVFFFCLFGCFFGLPGECVGSQARGRIGAVATGLRQSYSNAGSEPRLPHLHHSSRQLRILNPLSKVRDRIRNLMVPSQIRFRCATTGTSSFFFFIKTISGQLVRTKIKSVDNSITSTSIF